jgi:hypothetical protein
MVTYSRNLCVLDGHELNGERRSHMSFSPEPGANKRSNDVTAHCAVVSNSFTIRHQLFFSRYIPDTVSSVRGEDIIMQHIGQ